MRALGVVALLAASAAASSAGAAGIQVDVIPNFIGAGLGVTTEWLGAKDTVAGIVPGGRVALEKNRFIEVYGPIADMNVLDSPNWEFGPMVSYRFGRSEVKDPVVNLLPPIDGGLEAGVFAGWHFIRAEGIPYRVRLGVSLTTAVSGGAAGGHVTPYASLWVPLSRTLFVGFGGGLTWSSDSFMQQRFGVSPQASAASGLPAYSAAAGVRQYYLWPAVLWNFAPNWFAGAGGFWQRITGRRRRQPDHHPARRPRPDQRGRRSGLLLEVRLALLFLLLAASQTLAQSNDKRGLFTDPEDGAFDASEWLLDKKGFLPSAGDHRHRAGDRLRRRRGAMLLPPSASRPRRAARTGPASPRPTSCGGALRRDRELGTTHLVQRRLRRG